MIAANLSDVGLSAKLTLILMAPTKQTAKKSTGAPAPRKSLGFLAVEANAPQTAIGVACTDVSPGPPMFSVEDDAHNTVRLQGCERRGLTDRVQSIVQGAWTAETCCISVVDLVVPRSHATAAPQI